MAGDSGEKKMIGTVEIKRILQAASVEELPEFIRTYVTDERQGVRKLVETAAKRLKALETERARIEELCIYEKQYAQYDFICGVDEVGRGPLAGPVAAGAVILPKGCRILYINDS
ncbi:MAG TPA: ribonuclease HII, partial [Lachnospiraceae bacterium]|nr:ribonuclease HII [Lachnospiraceae bacterium]